MVRPMTANMLRGTDWEAARALPLTQDASTRSYQRLVRGDGATAILAHDPNALSRENFIKIGTHLREIGLSAPELLNVDHSAGLMLLEDLGDGLFPNVIASDPACEAPLYHAAFEAILVMTHAPAPDVAPLGPDDMAQQAALVIDWYGTGSTPDLQTRLAALIHDLISPPSALMLRDMHAENLIWLPGRSGPARVGLLDFQDARLATPLYDLVSLITDARRDVPRAIADDLMQHAATAFGRPLGDILAEAAALSLQRNLRILGIFARLCLRDGRAGYLGFMPRVWGHIEAALDHLNDAGLTEAVQRALPAPTPPVLQDLEARCGTHPTP